MNSNIRKQIILTVFLIAFPGTIGLADNAAVQDKLKREVKVALDDVTIVETLEQIGERAGLTIELSDEAIWELPEGAETRLSVSLEGPLDQSLEEMLNAFFLRYAVGSDAVVIYPRPELEHIAGRPTARTLELLRNIYTNGMHLRGDAKIIEPVAQPLIRQMAGKDISVSPLDMLRGAAKVMGQMAEGSPDGISIYLAPVLDEVTESVYGGSGRWLLCAPEFPSQTDQIKFLRSDEFREAGLNRVIDISFQREVGLTILKHVAAVGDFELGFTVGDDRAWLEREISIEALNMTVEEALSRVTATLGGEGDMTGDGVYVVSQKQPSAAAAAARARAAAAARAAARRRADQGGSAPAPITSAPASGDYVGKISIPMDGGRYFLEFMLRESDLTEELRRLRAERIKEILQAASNPPETAPTP